MSYKQEAQELVQNLNQRMGASPYDIAWLGRLRNKEQDKSRWPDLLGWLLENQRPDGSWGGEISYYHDRIICTLAAAIALHENGSRCPGSEQAVKRAETFLWQHLHFLHRDPFELVGFELLFPTLLEEARAVGLDIPNHTCGYGKIQAEKLRLIPPQYLYSPHISTVHSLEFLGKNGDSAKMAQAVSSNGSLGNSPATTAYYLMLNGKEDPRGVAYLENLRRSMENVIYLYPFSTFELTWALNNLAFSGLPITDFASTAVWDKLRSQLTEVGIGLDPTFGIPDGDITSVTSRLLLLAGYDIDPAVLARFQDKETFIFKTYDFERNISIGTNLHALETLELMTADYPDREKVSEEIIIKLLDNRIFNIYWMDKWHASPFYATAHVLVGMLRHDVFLSYVCRPTIDWLLHTQRPNGSWGFYDVGTVEETAYVLTALLYYHQHEPIKKEVLQRAADFLAANHQGPDSDYPELWIGKCLYTPQDVVRSAVLSALIQYEALFGSVG
ncbi:MAG: prenyltransferase/squalene oxidase repeat-containing protein [Candidatus Promineifilaceae bacterium]